MVAKALLSDDQLAIEYTIHTCSMVAIVEYFLAAFAQTVTMTILIHVRTL